MLVDNVTLIIKAGNGGNGAATFLRNGLTAKGGPDGGNGGNGGSIYIQGSHNINDLSEFRYKKKIRAEDGVAGKNKKLFGKNAENKTIFVPLGTQITDIKNEVSFEIIDTKTPILIAKGGRGGRGNTAFKTSVNQSPKYAEKGTPGEEKELFLSLRLIADIGLIGLPNAGKSSILAKLTHANPKIGDYPFTTIEPNIGMLGNFAIADIPGLIEGASTGKGLGTDFLKHIEKTKLLLHCIDSSNEQIEVAYETVRKEFKEYSSVLLEKEEIILLTKTDIADKKILEKNIKFFEKKGKKVLTCSIYDEKSIEALKKTIKNAVILD